uniref:HotDog ACOT-type domain-containing protein n=1 Tax=Glossina brevipalpis TaxID=37001 RepID=A0A1A9WRN7_9MUSC
MSEVTVKLMDQLGVGIGYQPKEKKRDHLLKYTPKQEELPSRSMKDSYISAIIPLRTDKSMQEKYVNQIGTIRLGRLIEAMDFFAVWVCQQYVKIPNLPPEEHLPYIFMTIIVDRMHILGQLPSYDKDLRISGYVTWVGRTSLEVSVWVHLIKDEKISKITHANFVMAARNATNTGSAPVNPLKIETNEEKKLSNEAKARRKLRQESQKASIWQKKPTQEEHDLIYDFVEKTTDKQTLELNKRILPENGRWMSDSFALNNIMSFPENRNAQNTAFGGFLMRNALEISHITAFKHCKARPKLEYAFEFSFDKPVAIQSMLRMLGYVIYVEKNYMLVMAINDVLEPTTAQKITSNVSYFIFSCSSNVQQIYPRSYHEALLYIHGQRKFRNANLISQPINP